MPINKAIWIIPIFIVFFILFIYIFLIIFNTHEVDSLEENVVVKITPSWNIFNYLSLARQSAVFSKEKIGVGDTVTITDKISYPDNFPIEDIERVIHYLKRSDTRINISLLEVPVKGVQYSASLETIAIINVTNLLKEGNIVTTTWTSSKPGFYITITQVFTSNTAFKNFPGNQVEVVEETPAPPISEISAPLKPTPKLLTRILQELRDFLYMLFSGLKVSFTLQTVLGPEAVEPGESAIYTIDLSAPSPPDSDYSDGNYSIQYGKWALIDSSNNVIQEGDWKEIFGRYQDTVIITVPQKIDEYVLLAIIDEIQMEYDFLTKTWIKTSENIISKEGYNLQTKLPVIVDQRPSLSIGEILSNFWNWFKGLFGL